MAKLVFAMSFWSLAFTSNCGSTGFVAFVWSPADIVKANNFYHTDSEVAFWGQWWILESVTALSSSKSQVSIQEYASAAPSKRLELPMIQYTFSNDLIPAPNSDHSGVPRHEELLGPEILAALLILVFRIRLHPWKMLNARRCEPGGEAF